MDQQPHQSGWSWWYLLLLVLVVLTLWVPLYKKVEPTLGGMPFFYWFQLALVVVGAILTGVVYFALEKK